LSIGQNQVEKIGVFVCCPDSMIKEVEIPVRKRI